MSTGQLLSTTHYQCLATSLAYPCAIQRTEKSKILGNWKGGVRRSHYANVGWRDRSAVKNTATWLTNKHFGECKIRVIGRKIRGTAYVELWIFKNWRVFGEAWSCGKKHDRREVDGWRDWFAMKNVITSSTNQQFGECLIRHIGRMRQTVTLWCHPMLRLLHVYDYWLRDI